MADESSRSTTESIRLWLNAVALPVLLALGGVYQFYLKEVLWPAAAINLTTEVAVKEVGLNAQGRAEGKNLEAIELSITARNSSTNTVYLCSNYWAAWGITISVPKQANEKNKNWLKDVANIVNKKGTPGVGKHYKSDQKILIAASSALTDIYLRTNERVSNTFVFYVPHGVYDLVEVKIYLPTTSRESPARDSKAALGVEYRLKSDDSDFEVASVTPSGTDEPITADSSGRLDTRDAAHYGWQIAGSTVQFSLWQTKTSGLTTTPPVESSSP